MSLLSKNQMLIEMEEHLGINCMEYTHLSSTDRAIIILYEICRHIPKYTGPRKGQVSQSSKHGIIKP